MSGMSDSLYNFRLLDELSKKDSAIHKLHPVSKLLATVFYIVAIVSFNKYAISQLIPFLLYPLLIFILSDLPLKPLLKMLIPAELFVAALGIFNPLLDKTTFLLGGLKLSMGMVSLISLILKCTLIVFCVILFAATTGSLGIAYSMRRIKMPKIIVMLFLMIYRYIAVFLEEFENTVNAYKLRNPLAKGVEISAWGSLLGLSFIRAYDRAQSIYDCMLLRGFDGEYKTAKIKIKVADFVFLLLAAVGFLFFRLLDISQLIGSLLVR
ncbi:MAG TPA: cobalt ECF transporter T component CbiQ [Ruminococcaceae bacterium]|nr:cobalt ECF transporter T component CbiQ [Oscillospiraceae bacterium]